MIMTKAASTAPEASPEAGFLAVMGPMQESLDRFRQATEKLSSSYADIATHQANFVQKEIFDALLETQGLSRVRNPAEFFELGNEFAWQQAERSLKAFGELGTEMCKCWIDAFKTAADLSAKAVKGPAAH
jgi:hypothetical protein